MSVLVKGMDMPDSCKDCPCSKNLVWCFAVAKPRAVDHLGLERPDWCPLVAISVEEEEKLNAED